jgi:hypothetical protein
MDDHQRLFEGEDGVEHEVWRWLEVETPVIDWI